MNKRLRRKLGPKIIECCPGDEIGNTTIVWLTFFYDKVFDHIALFIGIDKKAKYHLFRSDSSDTLYDTNIKSNRLEKIILESLKIMKQECRIKHKKWAQKKFV